MFNKLVLITDSSNLICKTSINLVTKLRSKGLIRYVNQVSKEKPCWIHKNTFLSIQNNESKNILIINNHINIIKYLEKEKLKHEYKESNYFKLNKKNNVSDNNASDDNASDDNASDDNTSDDNASDYKNKIEKKQFKLKEYDYNKHIISNDPTYNWLA